MNKIHIIQSAFKSGKIEANASVLREAYELAVKDGADFVIAPLQALCGFKPEILLKYSSYVQEYCLAAEQLIDQTQDTVLIFDIPLSTKDDVYKPLYIAACNGIAYKSSSKLDFVTKKGERVSVRQANSVHLYPELNSCQADILVITDANTFVLETVAQQEATLCNAAAKVKTLVYANQAGGIGSYVLTGCSSVFEENGRTRTLWPWWQSAYNGKPLSPGLHKWKDLELIHDALVCAIRDYFLNAGLKSAVLGLSGGIDSAVVFALAAAALGAENTLGILMPSRYSTDHSISDAVILAQNLGSPYNTIAIEPLYKTFLEQLDPFFKDTPFGLAEENLQARIRGNLLMAISNKKGNLVLNTSNKSESACGYGTLYGDLCGGLSILGDLYKSQVYALANYINRDKEIIPYHCINKAPSAELHPDQKDSDSLPNYDLIEKVLRLHLEHHLSEQDIVEKVNEASSVKKILNLLKNSGYKRRQTAPVIRISSSVLSDRNTNA